MQIRRYFYRVLMRLAFKIWARSIVRVAGSKYHVRATGNRQIRIFTIDDVKWEITTRDLSISDGFCREEMITMLATLRLDERIQGWDTPDTYPCAHPYGDGLSYCKEEFGHAGVHTYVRRGEIHG